MLPENRCVWDRESLETPVLSEPAPPSLPTQARLWTQLRRALHVRERETESDMTEHLTCTVSFTGAFAQLSNLAGVHVELQGLHTSQTVIPLDLSIPYHIYFQTGIDCYSDNTLRVVGGNSSWYESWPMGKGRCKGTGHIKIPLSLPFMDGSNGCFLLADFPEKAHILSKTSARWLTSSLYTVCVLALITSGAPFLVSSLSISSSSLPWLSLTNKL